MFRTTSIRQKAAAAASCSGVAAVCLAAGATPALATTTTHRQKPKTVTAVAQSVVADFYTGDFHVQFSAQKAAGAADDQATGRFSANALVGTTSEASLAGPVTCLDENGPYIGLFYPVTSSSPTALGSLIKGVYISLELGRTGQPLSMAFRPSLAAAASSCAPSPGMFPILAGTATVNGNTGSVSGF